MAKIANIARTGIDIFNLHALENPRAWDVCTAGIRSQIKMEQIAYDRKDLNILINVMETAEICYKNSAMFSSALKTLYKKPLQVSQTVRTPLQIQSTTNNQQTNIQTAPVQIDAQEATSIQQTNIQIFYQNLLSKLRETFQGSYNELELLDLLNQEIHAELKTIESKLKECESIINGEDITHFDVIPFLLQGQAIFQKRMCRISGKPIRKVVTVRESDNSKPIYYEWKNLQQALEKDTRPFKWPASLAFDPKFSIINMEETKEVINELKKASLNPEFKKNAQDTYTFYKTKKEEFEEVCKLIKTNLKTS